jgi:predicted transglutaminase-like cysteine proteinase
MRIEPIGVSPPKVYIPRIRPGTKKLGVVDITPLLPKPDMPSKLWDFLSPVASPFADLFDTLENIVATKIALIQINNTISTDPDSGIDYEKYLQFPDPRIQALATSIITPADSNDVKMYQIEQWVIGNIAYVSDIEQYAESELWALPTMTIDSRQGDCEDGAFLLHSLALHAGIPSDRLRTYGGLVFTGDGMGVGGHAWTTYQREIDNKWIIADWCYWPTDTPIPERSPMSENLKYIDDYFFVQATKTVETPYTNRVRFATRPPAFFLNTIV